MVDGLVADGFGIRLDPALLAKPTPAKPPGSAFPEERPTVREVHRRHKRITDRRGRPYWLPVVNWLYPDEGEDRLAWHPSGCLGPLQRKQPYVGKRRFLCDQWHFCAFCWERRCRQGGLWAALHHAGEENVVKFSISLPGVRMDAEQCKDARTKVARCLRKRGFDRVTMWIHTFGENPVEGAKGHLDGFASGPDAETAVFDVEHDDALKRVLKPFHARPDGGFWNPHISHRDVNVQSLKRNIRDLVLGGFYAGRPTFNTRRVLAGLYGTPADWRVRLTNVDRKKKPTEVEDLTDRLGRPVKDWSHFQLLHALRVAEEWKKPCGRPLKPRGIQLKPHVLEAVLADTKWRAYFRLPGDSDLRESLLAKR